MTVIELYEALEARIPRTLSCPWDNDGLSVCPDKNAPVTGVYIALDATEEAVNAALDYGCNVLLTHHPLLFRGVKEICGESTVSRKVIDLIVSGLSAMAFHTRLDTVDGGVNDVLAARLGLLDVTSFGDRDNAEGKEMGRIGRLPASMPPEDFAMLVKEQLNAPSVLCASADELISRVAVLGGSGDGDVAAALAAGADAYVTGELKYHQLCDVPFEGMSLVAAGHYHTEFPVCEVLRDMVEDIYDEADEEPVDVIVGTHCRIFAV